MTELSQAAARGAGLAAAERGRALRRLALLSSCALPALLLDSRPAEAGDCGPLPWLFNSPCAYYQQYGKAASGHHNGDAGAPGRTADSVAINMPPGDYVGPVIIVGNGEQGGDGRNSHYSKYGQHGGAGGAGGGGGNLSFTADGGSVTSGLSWGILLQAVGAAGGTAGHGSHGGLHGVGGNGGAGGSITGGTTDRPLGVSLSGGTPVGLAVQTNGGNGQDGVNYEWPGGSPESSQDDGGDAGNGAAGGNVSIVMTGSISNAATGIQIGAPGGSGGQGGRPYTTTVVGAQGGQGGNGAQGGNISLWMLGSIDTTGNGGGGAAMSAISQGGQGGAGGQGGGYASGGIAGSGAAGGSVDVTLAGMTGIAALTTNKEDSPGILAQSLGGVGANGGQAGGWGAGGGYGGTGGNGGAVSVVTGAFSTITTSGTNAMGIVAQSIGGGGGNGGNSNGWVSVGGDGGTAAHGGPVTVNTTGLISTSGERADAVLAQSIGGGGGNGGNATSGLGIEVNLAIGGDAGGGGNSQRVAGGNSGTLTTTGAHASGLVLQSIGGGGGNGGAAYATSVGGLASVGLTVGGKGGDGGAGNSVAQLSDSQPTNSGAILTAGSDSYGILAQSVGGGGGSGGASASTALAFAVPTEPEPPSVSLSSSAGGKGGGGGSALDVTIRNSGMIGTSGAMATAMVAQSIGGGGGTGGDSSASSSAQGGGAFNFSGSLALGGKGGAGGNGGAVVVGNSGLIITTGESADGILAQSIGGGGGAGGLGDATASSEVSADYALSVSLGMGGGGGAGASGGTVDVTNAGAILTLGDGAAGIVAQSIGGGGGRGGGAGGGAGGTWAVNVQIGGSGGIGGDAPYANPVQDSRAVTVTNTGTIVTFGAGASGIVAQSIAGGGGNGGKTGSNIGSESGGGDGGVGTATASYGALNSILEAYRAGEAGNGAKQYGSMVGLLGAGAELLGISGNPVVENLQGLLVLGGELGTIYNTGKYIPSLSLQLGIGGKAGSGGQGGDVTVTNSGQIGTMGMMSHAILAQSIGGGGGLGGAASSASSDQIDIQSEVSIGGRGGQGGHGGTVTVNNSGALYTIGGLSAGIVAQSIGGGGGAGGIAGANSTADTLRTVLSVPVSIGGSGGGSGDAGSVTVNNSADITTLSHNAIGVLAQSIAGGGGILKTFSLSPEDNAGGQASVSGGSFGLNAFHFGGSGGTSGTASSVTINLGGGTIGTGGRNAYGVLAQSIGGGGGVVLGGTPQGSSFFGQGQLNGDGSAVTVALQNGAAISTTGIGGIGILAQSIGGGGGLAGDTGMTAQRAGFAGSGAQSGNGGPVSISVDAASSIRTAAGNTPAMLLQSIGGGGGRVTNNGYGAFSGTAGGSGVGGPISVTVDGLVSASGAASQGIFAEIAGQASASPAAIGITVNAGGTVSGGTDFNVNDGYGAGVYLVGGGSATAPNTITNAGIITSVNGASGTAIFTTGGNTQVINSGTIIGNQYLAGTQVNSQLAAAAAAPTGARLENLPGGRIIAGERIALGAGGQLRNAGRLEVGATGSIASATIEGDLHQTSGGRLVVDTHHAQGSADLLTVQGRAHLGGLVEVHVASMAQRPVTVLNATGGMTTDADFAASRTHLYRFDTLASASSLQLQPQAEFVPAAAALNPTQRDVAAQLQDLWDGNAAMEAGFTALASVADAADYARALNSLSGQATGAIAAFRYNASRDFVANMLNECPTFEGPGTVLQDRGCAWGRATGTHADQSGRGGALGYQASAWSFQTGGQWQLAPGWFLGGSLAYETSLFRGDAGSSRIGGDSLLAGVTLRHQSGPWQLTGALDLGYGWYDSRRSIAVGDFRALAKADPSIWHAGLHGRAAYQIPFDAWYLQPRLDLRLTHLSSKGYTESGGSPFNLAVEKEGDTAFVAEPAIELGGRLALGSAMVLRPFASIGVELAAERDWATTARFADQPGSGRFRARTPVPEVLGRVTLGASLLSGADWDLQLRYSTEFGEGYRAHAGLGQVTFRF